MLVEIGEKSSFFGNPCDTCGKIMCRQDDGDKQSNQIHVNFQASIHELHMGTTRTDSSHSAQLLQCLILESSIVFKYFKIFDETSISTVGIIKLSLC